MRYRAILFDMDGVLIDSETLMARTGVVALKKYGINAKPEDFAEFVGQGEDRYVGGVAEKYGHVYTQSMKHSLYDEYGKLVAREARIPEGEREVLTELRGRGYQMAVCSSADREKVSYNLAAIGLGENFFDYVVTGSEVTRQKPAPDIYLKAAERLGAAPETCLVVEDAPSGIKAAHAAGMKAAGIASSFSRAYLTARCDPDYLLDALKELPDIL
jgi:beta-phosphoglucomutase